MSSPSPPSFTPDSDVPSYVPAGDHVEETGPSADPSTTAPWQLIDLQDCLHDSPQFRRMLSMKEHELTELERKLEKVVTTCSTMVDSGQVFRENCRLFSLSLKELSDHFNELPSVQDAFSKFCEIFNEIQTYYRILFDQAQRTVMKGLKDFLTGDLRKVHTSKKSFHKTSAELNYVIHKNATASRQKPETDEISSLLQTMQVEFTHQALDYCYQINVVSCLKGHRLTEKLMSFLGATSTFFHQGRESLKLLDPYLRELAQKMDKLQEQSTTDINYMKDRHSMVSSQHMQEDFSEMPADNISMPIVFRGYLFKRSHNAFKSWNRRYCELRDSKLFYLKKNSEDEKGIIADDLRLCTVKLADDLERRHCFEVVTPSRSCMLQADSDMDRRKWCMYLEAGIARALRVTSSNKSREMRRRLTSSNAVTPQLIENLTERSNASPQGIRADTPSSLNSNISGTFDFLDVPGNDCCADCSRPNPKWASLNIGILLCIDCSGIHRSLGVHISKVRSTTLDDWEPEHQKIMTLLGNDRVNSIYEFEVPSYVKKPTATTSSSDREEYIRLKYVSRAFVHPHPDFDRPKVPVPPPRIQSTLLRAVATSPKLAGRLNRPVSMTTGVEHHLSPSASPLPAHSPSLHHIHNVSSGDNNSPFGGLNLRPESMALLEENWKKLEKNGRLQQWNLKSMVNVVKSPRKSFNLSKFARPGSFRRKKSPLVTDDYPHSDNELDDPPPLYHTGGAQSQSVSPNLVYAPRKPPRTYTTTIKQIESSQSDSLFSSDSDDFSSHLLSTLDRLGSVYSISGLLREDMDGNHDDGTAGEEYTPHRKLFRSVSAQIDSGNHAVEIPKISIPQNTIEDSKRIVEEDETMATKTQLSTASREVTRSLTCLETGTTTNIDTNDGEEELVLNYDEEPINYTDDIRDRTLRNIDLSQFIDDDDSSVDSYQSAEDRNDLLSREHRPDSPIEIKRPDSEASELFHTPPNSISPCPSGLEGISPSHITSIGWTDDTLGDLTDIGGDLRNVKVDDEDDFGDESIHIPSDQNILEKDEETTSTSTEEPSTSKNDTPPSENVEPNDTPPSENVSNDVTLPPSLMESPSTEAADYDDTSPGAVFHEEEEVDDPYVEYEIHIIPDDISPSKFLFECSLNGDLGGILSGIAHGGVINQPHNEEGNKYPIHQACITGNETAVEFLYQNGAKLNVTDDRGCTALHLASMNGYIGLVATLLKRGADYTIVNNEGKTPEMYATDRKNGDIVAILKLAKADKEMDNDANGEEDSRIILEDTVATILYNKESSEIDSVKSRSLSSTNSSSSTDKGGSELSLPSTTGSGSVKAISGLTLSSKSKHNT